MLLLDLFSSVPDFGKYMVVAIVSLFMPLTAISFFYFMVPKKEKDYSKAMNDMGIDTERKVSDVHSFKRYLLPVGFVSLICFFASTYFAFANSVVSNLTDSLLLTGAFFGEANSGLIRQSLAVLSYAFFGSFIWSAQNIIRRLIAIDLSPSVYYSAGIRMILASVISLVISFILGKEGSINLFEFKASLTSIAFLAGMFPERFMQYLINTYQYLVNPDKLISNNLSLYRIEGISMSHKERLEEIGIDNAQNLASTSLTQLCLETPFEARTLLDWIAQAKLLCYVKENIDSLRSVGIRSAFDLLKVERDMAAINQIATDAKISPVLLANVYQQIKNDQGIQSLYKFQFGVNTPNAEKRYAEAKQSTT